MSNQSTCNYWCSFQYFSLYTTGEFEEMASVYRCCNLESVNEYIDHMCKVMPYYIFNSDLAHGILVTFSLMWLVKYHTLKC